MQSLKQSCCGWPMTKQPQRERWGSRPPAGPWRPWWNAEQDACLSQRKSSPHLADQSQIINEPSTPWMGVKGRGQVRPSVHCKLLPLRFPRDKPRALNHSPQGQIQTHRTQVATCLQPHTTQHTLRIVFFFFWLLWAACGNLVPWPGIEPRPTAVRPWSPKHWTSREVPQGSSF